MIIVTASPKIRGIRNSAMGLGFYGLIIFDVPSN